MWSANQRIRLYWKKHETCFYEWNGSFRTFRQIWVMSFRYPRWNPCTPSLHHMSPFGKHHHQLFTMSFHESPWFQFLAGALKNVLSRRFSAFWGRVAQWARADSKCAKNQNWWIWNFQCVSLVLGRNHPEKCYLVNNKIFHWFHQCRSGMGTVKKCRNSLKTCQSANFEKQLCIFLKKKAFNLTLDTLHAHCQANQTTQRTIMRL